MTDLVLCRECGKPIRRTFAGSVPTYGHVTNPKADHHYALPTSRQAVDTPPRRSTASLGAAVRGTVRAE